MKPALSISFILNIVLVALVAFMVSRADRGLTASKSIKVEPTLQAQTPTKSANEADNNKGRVEAKVDSAPSYAAIWQGSTADLYQQLKAWGAPNEIIVEILFAKDRIDYTRAKRLEILYPSGLNRWSAGPQPSREAMAKLNEMYASRREILRQIMGPDFDTVQAESDTIQRLKWGNIPGDKIAEVQKIKEQYDSLAIRNNLATGISKNAVRAAALINEEFSEDIRGVLTPSEAEDFLTYNSPAALTLQKDLSRAGIVVEENE
jgi:hypothetical protein